MEIGKIFNEAKNTLNDNYGKIVGINFAYVFFIFLLGLGGKFLSMILFGSSSINVFSVFLIPLLLVIVLVPMGYGYIKQYIDLYYTREVRAFDFLDNAFGNFGMVWKATLWLFFKYVIAYVIIVIASIPISAIINGIFEEEIYAFFATRSIYLIVGVILSLKYMFVNNELAYNDVEDAIEIVNKSAENMKGNKLRLFGYCLIFGVIVYLLEIILIRLGVLGAILLLIIYLFFIIPLMLFTFIVFYDDIRNRKMRMVEKRFDATKDEGTQGPTQNI